MKIYFLTFSEIVILINEEDYDWAPSFPPWTKNCSCWVTLTTHVTANNRTEWSGAAADVTIAQ
jgi:hypothetical protein